MAEVADTDTLQALDFPLLLAALVSRAQTEMGHDRLLALSPIADIGQLEERHAQVAEGRAWLVQNGSLSLDEVVPLTEILSRAAIEGAILQPASLLAIVRSARAARRIRDQLARTSQSSSAIAPAQPRPVEQCGLEGQEGIWPRLGALVSGLPDLGHLIGRINGVLTEEGDLRDGASAELGSLRRRRRRLRSKVLERLEQLVRSGGLGGVLQDRLVTQRRGRYVVPVRSEKRGSLRGVVHDTSSSGQTLYIEPLEVLEQQNELAAIVRAEEREVRKLLAELTAHVRGAASDLLEAQRVVTEFDALQAVCRFAEATGSVAPTFCESGLRLRAARHPLMIEAVGEQEAELVPMDLELAPDQHILVITGPNTGGKTVALKTVGILTLMAQCGLPVPATEACLCCCPYVHADIGDEQSIVASLSTFSAHLSRIRSFLRSCPSGSMVLLDELGTGTDPAEGAALGIALLERFDELGAMTLVSTHHDALKAFAHSYEGAVNAAMEFDSVTLRPTYHLRLGLPGRSNAFEIATRLGLDNRLVARARNLVQEETADLDSLLRSVEGEAESLASDRQEIEDLRRRLQAGLDRCQAIREELEELRERVRREGRDAIREVLERVGKQGARLLSDFSAELEEAANARAAADRRARWAARTSGLEAAANKNLTEAVTEAFERVVEEGPEMGTFDGGLAGGGEAMAATAEGEEDEESPLLRGEPVAVLPLGFRGSMARDWNPAVDDPASVEVDVRGKRLIVRRDQIRRARR
ncbi:MAG: hypothetical protein ACE5HV_00975 [Acidobacteriota bacterium]